MKKIFYLAAMAALAFSCTKGIEGPETTNYVQKEYIANLADGTKTSLEDGGKVFWSKGDIIRYYSKDKGDVSTYTVDESGAWAPLTMNVAEDASYIVAVYGGTGITSNTSGNSFTLNGAVQAVQTGKFEDAHVSLVKTSDTNKSVLKFSNVTSLIKFTLERSDVSYIAFNANDDSAIHGDGVLKFTFTDDTPSVTFGSSTGKSIKVNVGAAGTYYISLLPSTLASGFTIRCYDDGGLLLGTVTTEKSTKLSTNSVLNLGALDPRIVAAPRPQIKYTPNLSANGTANCYIVPMPGEYYFDATVKGSSAKAISGTIVDASILWVSFVTDAQNLEGGSVKSVRYENGKVYFTATGKNGNAVIAVRDSDDEILWSWHIWCCMNYDADFYAQEYNNDAGTMMDRNLGATSAKPGDVKSRGLLYQWGRKDPFLGNGTTSYRPGITYSAFGSEFMYDHLSGTYRPNTLKYAIAYPNVFLKGNSSNDDWYATGNGAQDELWASTKTEYDPCPAGYRVPDGYINEITANGVWAKAFGTYNSWTTSTNWDSTNKGMNLGSTDKALGVGVIWYPASGGLNYDFQQFGADTGCFCWSCSSWGYVALAFSFGCDGTITPSERFGRSYGLSVRCQKI